MTSTSPLRIAATILLTGILARGAAHAEEAWPQFRGPGGDGVATGTTGVPVRWGPRDQIRWRTELPGTGWSSPVVAGGRVYLTAAVPASEGNDGDHDLVLLIVDATSGQLQRTTAVFRQSAEAAPPIHSKNSHASPTPVVDGDRVYVHFGHQGTAATDLDGNVVWTNRELEYPPVHGNGGSPILVGDRLIFTCDGATDPLVAALNAKDGTVAWRTPRTVDAASKFSFCTPTAIEVGGRTQVVAPGSDAVMALDPRDGRMLWMVRYDGYSVVPKPVYADGHVFIATGFGPTKVLAIEPTHSGDATAEAIAWAIDRGAPKTPSLLAHAGLLYVLSDDGILTVVRTADGEQVYRRRLGGNYSASPVLAEGRVYLTSEEGKTTVISAGEEFEVLAENDLGERTLASLAVLPGALLIRTEAALYRVEAKPN